MYCSRSKIDLLHFYEYVNFYQIESLHMQKTIVALTLFAITLLTFIDAEAQRRASLYESLLQRTDQPSSYIDHIVLPSGHEEVDFSIIFRLDYDLISFLRIRSDIRAPRPEVEYFAPVRMGMEIFEGPAPSGRRSSPATSIFRDSWQDTIWVNTFEETKSRFNHVEAFIPGKLPPGEYHYELQLSRGGSINEQSSSKRTFIIPENGNSEKADFILLSHSNQTGDRLEAHLLNYNNNVLYGQDYTLLIRMPKGSADEGNEYRLVLDRLAPGSSISVEGINEYSVNIDRESMFHIEDISWHKSADGISFLANLKDDGVTYALVQIPNQNFENSRYRVRLFKNGENEHSGQKVINSQWLDMPVSLYNLDVAIEMMRFIVSSDELRRLQSGSTAERERKFREFWKERDPTPNTEFNELMAEYYRRIDYAYNNFTTMMSPGYETDQGRSYILYGPPNNIERRLPTNAPTREIWTYPNRTLIFEATTGFGDFRLISES